MITETKVRTVFKVEARTLDIISMREFDSELEILLKSCSHSLFLDFSQVEEVSSAVIGIILHKKMRMRKLGIEIHLLNVSHGIERILKILKLARYLLTSNTEEKAPYLMLTSTQ